MCIKSLAHCLSRAYFSTLVSCCFLPDVLCFGNVEWFMVPLSHTMLLYALLILFLLPVLPLQVLACLYNSHTLLTIHISRCLLQKPLLLFPAPPPMWIICPFQLLLCHSMHIILYLFLPRHLPHGHEYFGVYGLLNYKLSERRSCISSFLAHHMSPGGCSMFVVLNWTW